MTYVPGKGMLVTFPGQSVLLGEHMSVHAIQKHLRELTEWLGS